jgi:phosphoethanolamine N-methyltransferase
MTAQYQSRFNYSDKEIWVMELIWGEGFMSPGGSAEVALILEGKDISGCKVLDMGCGTGGIDVLLIRDFGAKRVLGLDVRQTMIDRCHARAAREDLSDHLSFLRIAPGRLPLESNSFDVVFSKEAIIHVADKLALFSEVFRILRPGGVFLACDWLKGGNDANARYLDHFLEMAADKGFTMVTLEDVGQMLAGAGFVEIKLRDRNAWYRDIARRDLERINGVLKPLLNKVLGRDAAEGEIAFWRAVAVAAQKEVLRPAHFQAHKPP